LGAVPRSAQGVAHWRARPFGQTRSFGSTTAKAIEDAGHVPVILDSLLTGPRAFVRDRIFYEGDIADRSLLTRVVEEHPDIACTVHMAARIVMPESVEQPYEYYRDNVAKSLEPFDQLVRLGKPNVVFSSSASLYATVQSFEVDECSPLDPPSPYARTKRMMEMVLEDMAAATDLRAIILRYFDPVGSDPDLQSGVYVREPSHVLGQLVMAAQGLKDAFTITGTDHPTRDGTGIRDYIHVWDLAQGAHHRLRDGLRQARPRCGGAATSRGRRRRLRQRGQGP
jgi:UDP-glucose 4-epimerase